MRQTIIFITHLLQFTIVRGDYMKLDKKGLDLIKSFEGCKLRAYKCVATENIILSGTGIMEKTPSITLIYLFHNPKTN